MIFLLIHLKYHILFTVDRLFLINDILRLNMPNISGDSHKILRQILNRVNYVF